MLRRYPAVALLVLATGVNLLAHDDGVNRFVVLKHQLRLGTFTSGSYLVPLDAEAIQAVVTMSDEDVLDPEHYLRIHFEFTPTANVGDHFVWGFGGGGDWFGGPNNIGKDGTVGRFGITLSDLNDTYPGRRVRVVIDVPHEIRLGVTLQFYPRQ
jgi:hypothetical protein